MKKLLLVPALLFAACGDNLQPDAEQIAPTNTSEDAPTDAPELIASFIFEPNDCGDHSVRFEGRAFYADGTPLDNPVCHYQLEDGSIFDGCFAVIPLPTSQNVTFVATDPATGAFATDQEGVVGPASFEATADVTSNGLSISWDAHANYGGVIDPSNARISISIDPAANVIVEDPQQLNQSSGTVTVTEAGTYTVHVSSSISFGEVGGCGAFLDKTVEVVCTGDAH